MKTRLREKLAIAFAVALTLIPISAFAQGDDSTPDNSPPSSYQIGEDNTPAAPDAGTDSTSTAPQAGQGPVRMADFSYVSGDITWRLSDSDSWAPAAVNMPLRQSAEISVAGGRAELQFDDGTYLRLGNGAVVTLQTLYSDSQGEFTEIKMNEGLSALSIRHGDSIYQIDTPYASVITHGPSKVRVGIDDGLEVAVREGTATLDGQNGKKGLNAGDYLFMASSDSQYQVAALPTPDSWDQWNDERDQQLADSTTAKDLPPDIGLVAGDLDAYGTWHNDPQYGNVWCPAVSTPGWRPYESGHWVWVDPFGWTWVGTEPWGWAPYHYGTWIHLGWGWSWVPGPAVQYWSPAVVSFCDDGGDVVWAPLCPAEVRYPASLSVGFGRGNWSLFFSIGGCAVYYPFNDSYCTPRPWGNVFINRYGFGGFNHVAGDFQNHNQYWNNHFVPFNSRYGGSSMVNTAGFGGRGVPAPVPISRNNPFQTGRPIGAPPSGQRPASGPMNVTATRLATTPTRSFAATAPVASKFLSRPVFRAPLPQRIAKIAPPVPAAQVASRTNGAAANYDRSVGYPFQARNSGSSPAGANPANAARQTLGSPPAGSFGNNGSRNTFQAPPENQSAQNAAQSARQSIGFAPGSTNASHGGGSAPSHTFSNPGSGNSGGFGSHPGNMGSVSSHSGGYAVTENHHLGGSFSGHQSGGFGGSHGGGGSTGGGHSGGNGGGGGNHDQHH